MYTNYPSLIETFIEDQRDNLHQFLHNITFYYKNFRFDVSEKSIENLLYFTIILTFLSLIIILLTIFEYKLLLKLYLFIYSFSKLKTKCFQSKTLPFSNWLLNTPNHIQKQFLKEFIHSLNKEFSNKKVIEYFSFIPSVYSLFVYVCIYHCFS
jgi:hypothetical protein